MRFSSNGYYIEKYDKCSVCGKLVYEGEEVSNTDDTDDKSLYCSEWCIDWEDHKNELIKKHGVSG